jgi:hypothetical protein
LRMRHPIASLLGIAGLFAGYAVSALAQSASVPTTRTVAPSSMAKPGDAGVRAHTNLQYLGSGPVSGSSQAGGPPFAGYLFETPASLACIYELQPPEAECNPNLVTANPQGGSRAIAIVDAYDDPNAFVDLAVQPPSAAPKPRVVYFAATGENPGVLWPSASVNVVSVGGTTLSTNLITGDSTIRMAFLAASPMSITKPTWE